MPETSVTNTSQSELLSQKYDWDRPKAPELAVTGARKDSAERTMRENIENIGNALGENYVKALGSYDEGKVSNGTWARGLGIAYVVAAATGETEKFERRLQLLQSPVNADLGTKIQSVRNLVAHLSPPQKMEKLVDGMAENKSDTQLMKSLEIPTALRDEAAELFRHVRDQSVAEDGVALSAESNITRFFSPEQNELLDIPAFLDRVMSYQVPYAHPDVFPSYELGAINQITIDGKGPRIVTTQTVASSEGGVSETHIQRMFNDTKTGEAAAILIESEGHEVMLLRTEDGTFSLFDAKRASLVAPGENSVERGELHELIEKANKSILESAATHRPSFHLHLLQNLDYEGARGESCLADQSENQTTSEVAKILLKRHNVLGLELAHQSGRYDSMPDDAWGGVSTKAQTFTDGVLQEHETTAWDAVRANQYKGGPVNNCGDPDSAGTHTQENVMQANLTARLAADLGFTELPSVVQLDPADKTRMQTEAEDLFFNEQKPLAKINSLKMEIAERRMKPVDERTPTEVAQLKRLEDLKASKLDFWGQISGRPGAGLDVAKDQARMRGVPLWVVDGNDPTFCSKDGQIHHQAIEANVREYREGQTPLADADNDEALPPVYVHFIGRDGRHDQGAGLSPSQLSKLPDCVDSYSHDFSSTTSIPSELILIRGEPEQPKRNSAEPSYVGSADTTKDGSLDATHVRELSAARYVGSEALALPIVEKTIDEAQLEKIRRLDQQINSLDAGELTLRDQERLLADMADLAREIIVDSVEDSDSRAKIGEWLAFTDLLNQHDEPRMHRVMGYPYGAISHTRDNLMGALRAGLVLLQPKSLLPGEVDAAEQKVVSTLAGSLSQNPEKIKGHVVSGGTSSNDLGIQRGFAVAEAQGKRPIIFGSEGAHYSFDKIVGQIRSEQLIEGKVVKGSQPAIVVGDNRKGEVKVPALVKAVKAGLESGVPEGGTLKDSKTFPVLFLTHGTTNSGACDSVKEIIVALEEAGISRDQYYIHLDGAYSMGFAPVADELKEEYENQGWRFGFDSEPVDSTLSDPEKDRLQRDKDREPKWEWGTVLDVVDSTCISGHKAFNAVSPDTKICSAFLHHSEQHGAEGARVKLIPESTPIEDKRDGRVSEAILLGLETAGPDRVRQDLQHKIKLSSYFNAKMAEITEPEGKLPGMFWVQNNNTFVLPRIKNLEFAQKWGVPYNSSQTHIVIQAHQSQEVLDAFLEDAVQVDAFGVQARAEANARRREVSTDDMNAFYKEALINYLDANEGDKSKMVKGLEGLDINSTAAEIAERVSFEVLDPKTLGPKELDQIDTLMMRTFTGGGEPITQHLMDASAARQGDFKAATPESFKEFCTKARENIQKDGLCLAIWLKPKADEPKIPVMAVTIMDEGYVAKSAANRDEFSRLSEHERAMWVREGKAIKRGDEFAAEAMLPQIAKGETWIEQLGGVLETMNSKDMVYGPNAVTNQKSASYVFMIGGDPDYRGRGLGNAVMAAIDAQNEAKGYDASIAEFTSSASRYVAQKYNWVSDAKALYADYGVWQYQTPDRGWVNSDKKLTAQEQQVRGYSAERLHKPFADFNWKARPYSHSSDSPDDLPERDLKFDSQIKGAISGFKLYGEGKQKMPVSPDEIEHVRRALEVQFPLKGESFRGEEITRQTISASSYA